MAEVITIAMQKGGCGKTTTAINMSAYLALKGKKVLIIDLDPQAHTTIGLGKDEWNLPASVSEALLVRKDINQIIQPTEIPGLDIAPCNIDLTGVEGQYAATPGREYILEDVLQKLNGYNYVIIDTPPNLGFFTVNAIVACNTLIVPLQVEYYALSGYAHMLKTLELVERLLKRKPKQKILLTMHDARTKDSGKLENQIRDYFKGAVFNTVIPRNIKLSRAPSKGEPIAVYSPDSAGAIAYRDLVEEFLDDA
jgi:chromosome partitioning protein